MPRSGWVRFVHEEEFYFLYRTNVIGMGVDGRGEEWCETDPKRRQYYPSKASQPLDDSRAYSKGASICRRDIVHETGLTRLR